MKLTWKIIAGFIVVLIILAFYFFVNPAKTTLYISCPFKIITGYDCPGCGSQRALHYLLHFRIKEAFVLNPLFVLSLLFGFCFGLLDFVFPKSLIIVFFKSNKKGFLFLFIFLFFLYFVLRNTTFYKDFIESI